MHFWGAVSSDGFTPIMTTNISKQYFQNLFYVAVLRPFCPHGRLNGARSSKSNQAKETMKDLSDIYLPGFETRYY